MLGLNERRSTEFTFKKKQNSARNSHDQNETPRYITTLSAILCIEKDDLFRGFQSDHRGLRRRNGETYTIDICIVDMRHGKTDKSLKKKLSFFKNFKYPTASYRNVFMRPDFLTKTLFHTSLLYFSENIRVRTTRFDAYKN